MSNSIVVPLDGSALAEQALGPARALARHSHTDLRLVRVAVAQQMLVPEGAGYGILYPDQSLVEERAEATQYLADLQAGAAPDDAPIVPSVREGDVAGEIVDCAQSAAAQMIVMSSHGYTGMKRRLLGSVAERVMEAAPCPVWIVRRPGPPQSILVTLDGSQLAEEVLPPALAVARCFGTKVTLLRVVAEIRGTDVQALERFEHGLGYRYLDQTFDEAAAYLNVLAEQNRAGDLDLTTAVRSGPPADAILDYADRHAVDLVAMTTHGRTGLRRWLYGSVVHAVLDELPASMLVARSRAADLR